MIVTPAVAPGTAAPEDVTVVVILTVEPLLYLLLSVITLIESRGDVVTGDSEMLAFLTSVPLMVTVVELLT